MLLQRAITLAAIGILAFTGNHNTAHAEPLAIVHGTSGSDAIKISASYLAAFDNDNDPEPSFELVDTPNDVSSKLISLKKRGSGCADYYTGKHTSIATPCLLSAAIAYIDKIFYSQERWYLWQDCQEARHFNQGIHGSQLANQQQVHQLARPQEVLRWRRFLFFLGWFWILIIWWLLKEA